MEDASLTTKGVVKLSSAVDSTSESLAATPKAVKAANDNANSRVPSNRKVNGKALTADITLTPKDIGTFKFSNDVFSLAGWVVQTGYGYHATSEFHRLHRIDWWRWLQRRFYIRQAFQNWFYEQAMETPKELPGLCGSVQPSGLMNFASINTPAIHMIFTLRLAIMRLSV